MRYLFGDAGADANIIINFFWPKTVNIFKNMSEVSAKSIKSSDFIYPFFATENTERLHGYYYMPFIDVPPIMYITEKKGTDVKKFILKVFPISLICILMSVVSGFVC